MYARCDCKSKLSNQCDIDNDSTKNSFAWRFTVTNRVNDSTNRVDKREDCCDHWVGKRCNETEQKERSQLFQKVVVLTLVIAEKKPVLVRKFVGVSAVAHVRVAPCMCIGSECLLVLFIKLTHELFVKDLSSFARVVVSSHEVGDQQN